jgi:hypothetical protein
MRWNTWQAPYWILLTSAVSARGMMEEHARAAYRNTPRSCQQRVATNRNRLLALATPLFTDGVTAADIGNSSVHW